MLELHPHPARRAATIVDAARRAAVPRPRRAAHLPRPAGCRRRAARPPRARALPGAEPAVRRHVGHAGRAGHARRAAGRGRARRHAGCSARRSSPTNVIGETLRRGDRADVDLDDPAFRRGAHASASATGAPPDDYAAFVADPLGVLDRDDVRRSTRSPRPGVYRALRPRPLRRRGRRRRRARRDRPASTGATAPTRSSATLHAGYACDAGPGTGSRSSRSACTSSSARGETRLRVARARGRRATSPTSGQQFVPGDRPRALCCRWRSAASAARSTTPSVGARPTSGESLVPREICRPHRRARASATASCTSRPTSPWPDDDEAIARPRARRLARDATRGASERKNRCREHLPQPIRVAPDGTVADGGRLGGHFVPAPFRFCLRCGVAYGAARPPTSASSRHSAPAGAAPRRRSSASRRSAACAPTTSLEPEARKLLSFTDNRQDASLQAGHFNDFVEVGLLRVGAATARSDAAGPDGLRARELAQRVFDALGAADRAVRDRPRRRGSRRRPRPTGPCATCSATGSTATSSAAGGSPRRTSSSAVCWRSATCRSTSSAQPRTSGPDHAPGARDGHAPRRATRDVAQGAARLPAPRAGDQGRLPATATARSAPAALAAST